MLGRPFLLISLLFGLSGELMAKPSLEPFPSRESLRELQLQAYESEFDFNLDADPIIVNPLTPINADLFLQNDLYALKGSTDPDAVVLTNSSGTTLTMQPPQTGMQSVPSSKRMAPSVYCSTVLVAVRTKHSSGQPMPRG